MGLLASNDIGFQSVQKSVFRPPTRLAPAGFAAISLFGPVGPPQQQIDNGAYRFTAVE